MASQQIQFDVIYAGDLQRQQHTAQLVCTQFAKHVECITDARWNEFKLGEVYQEIAMSLCAESSSFAADFAAMKIALAENPYAMDGAVARCDRAVMHAWLTNRFPAGAFESWAAFQARVQAAFSDLSQPLTDKNIAVFTSAMPIAIAAGAALALSDEKIINLAWVLYNTGMTAFNPHAGTFQLYTLNATPHLLTAELHTFR